MNFKTGKNLYIAGEWISGGNTNENVNPSDITDIVGNFSQANKKQTEEAIDAARAAQPLWSSKPLEEKQKILHAIGDELIKRCDELGELLAREEGKVLAEGRGEVFRAGQFFQYYAAEVLRQTGENATSVRPGVSVEVTREPVGVVAVITPWNFPTAVGAWKIAPALAFGNSVVWKPANLTPASAVALTDIIHRQGLPKGTFNLVVGSGREVGNVLINSKKIDAVTFTGSVETGRTIATATAQNFVRCQLEMGSKNALVIAEDANVDIAVEATLAGSFSGTGQKCTASSRIIVMDAVHDAFLSKLLKRMETIKVGHALEKETTMGPVVDGNQLKSNLEWVEKAKKDGAKLSFGGEVLKLKKYDGYYMMPTLFSNTSNSWEINREEVFGPVASIIPAKNLEDAIAIANDTPYGLTAGIITKSLRTSVTFKQQIETGCVMINLPTAGTDYHVPFGGRKQSSYGPREQGQYAKEFYTIVKTTYQRPY